MGVTVEEQDREVSRAWREIQPVLRRLTPSQQSRLMVVMSVDVAMAADESGADDRGTSSPATVEKKATQTPTIGTHVRRVFREAKQWLTTAEVVAEVRKMVPGSADPGAVSKRVYATINKMANKGSKPLARRGEPPSISYATRENAVAWEARERKAAPPVSKPEKEPTHSPNAGDLVRKIFADATRWLTTTEVLAEARKVDPQVKPKQVWGAVSKASTSKKLARYGRHPGILYATREHATAWGEPTEREHLNGSADKRPGA